MRQIIFITVLGIFSLSLNAQQKSADFYYYICLNHDSHKIFMISKIKNPANPKNLNKILVQDKKIFFKFFPKNELYVK